MKKFVLDCSVVFYWIFDKDPIEYFTYAKKVRDSFKTAVAIVPSLWQLEVTNVLLTAERKGKITFSEILLSWSNLKEFPIEIANNLSNKDILHLAFEFDLTAYDACYLSLALEKNLPIATLDQDLIKAAKKAGVEIYQG